MAFVDYAIIVGYLALTLGIGVAFCRKGGRSMGDFFLSGRTLPWWLAGISMVATTFASDTPLIITEWVRQGGIWRNWVWLSLGVTQVIAVFLFATLWRRMGVVTDLELIEHRYGGRPAVLLRGFKAGYFAIVYNFIVLGWVLKGMSVVVTVMFPGLDPDVAIFLCVAVALAYSMLAGLTGVVWTDLVQFSLAMVGTVLFAVLAVDHVGGLDTLIDTVKSRPGGEAALTVIPGPGHEGFFQFLVLMLVMWWANHSADGGGYLIQRMMSCKDERHARGAALTFALVHNAFRIWPWILVALVTMVMLPGAVEGGDKAAYPRVLLDILPVGLKGLLVVLFLAAFMSTVDTHLNWGASYLVNDVYRRFYRPAATPRHYVSAARVTMFVVAVCGALTARQIDSLEKAFFFLLAMSMGIGPVLILRWFWWRINAWSELTALATSIGLAVGIKLGWIPAPGGAEAWKDYQMVLLIVPTSLVAWIVVTFLTPPEDGGRLEAFYLKARPGGAWGPIGVAVERLRDPVLTWWVVPKVVAGLVLVFGTLLGIGELLLGSTALGVGLLIAAGVSGAAAIVSVRRGS